MVSGVVSTLVVGASIGLAVLFVAGFWYASEKTHYHRGLIGAGVIVVWAALVFVLSAEGVFASTPNTAVPVIGIGIALPIVVGIGAWRSSERVRELAGAVPLPWMIGVQFYRVAGALFLVAMAQGALPREFAMSAGIGDVAVGLAAPIVAFAVYRKVRSSGSIATAWNLAGILDLVIAVSLGFLSSPSVFQRLALDMPSYAITRFPLVLIPTFAVPASILLHLAALKHPDAEGLGARSAEQFQLARR